MTVVNLPHFLAKTQCYHACFFFQKIANIGHERSFIFCHFEKKVTMRAVWFPHFWSFWDTLANFKILGDLRGDGGGEDGGWWLGCQNARRFYDKKSALSDQNGLARGCPWIYPTLVRISAGRLLACHVRMWGRRLLGRHGAPTVCEPKCAREQCQFRGNPEPSNFGQRKRIYSARRL